MVVWLVSFFQAVGPVLVPICFCFAWLLLAILAWDLWQLTQEGLAIARRLHQIPCARCRFFSGDYRLKCSLHPDWAATEAAIQCPDYHFE
ncbi:hypothetical protein NK55_10815 [Thermosynechococcus sp. NK55a]|jgi:hypothetical protein|uniref:hypothetical protein n=1 Tax=Thermosynechococcus sp. M3746_W2019_013 TaxID=2747806 RepID=UPI0003D94D59|nr:hypothetical protein [Thermosynechococcus sp. M3746_W2019_013]AHB89402.1 hypothetical protein NK55_10815 [Thermosynechococcus sp. NK55a]RMH64913.1 MAG: hypothetical protein D6676_08660 [Cyanobacteria bacterium J003]HIK22502.1 hypothetical protein [Thermosynechococcus sp. M3746_W2019_013]